MSDGNPTRNTGIIPGIVSVSFREKSPEQIIAEAKKNGLAAIEWGSDVHAPADRPDRLREIAALTKNAGLYCCSYGTYLHIGEFAAEELRLHIAAAGILGTNILRLWAGTKNSEEYSPEETEALFGECRTLARIAEEENVILCMECHEHTFTNRLEGALALMKAVHSEAFRMYWQPNRYRSVEENLTYAKAIAPFTCHIHVFNWNADGCYPLAEAEKDWKAYLSAFTGTHCALLEFMPDKAEGTFGRESRVLLKWTEELKRK